MSQSAGTINSFSTLCWPLFCSDPNNMAGINLAAGKKSLWYVIEPTIEKLPCASWVRISKYTFHSSSELCEL